MLNFILIKMQIFRTNLREFYTNATSTILNSFSQDFISIIFNVFWKKKILQIKFMYQLLYINY